MLLSCVCLLLGGVLQLSNGWAVTIFLACFAGSSVLGWTVIDVITPELAPTAVRYNTFTISIYDIYLYILVIQKK